MLARHITTVLVIVSVRCRVRSKELSLVCMDLHQARCTSLPQGRVVFGLLAMIRLRQ